MKKNGSTPGVKKSKNSCNWNTGDKGRQNNSLARVRKNRKIFSKKEG